MTKPVSRTALHAEVTARLREMIVEGVVAQGTRVNERLLCEELQISRTPLREALKYLAAEGLVELSPNRGATVTLLSPKEVAQVFEVLARLESLAGELAAARATDAEIAEIGQLHYEMAGCHAREDRPGYFRCNQAIHERISLAADNPVLYSTYNLLNTRVRRARFFANLTHERWQQSMREHVEIFKALEQRDAVKLGGLLEQHLISKRDVILAALESSAAEENGSDATRGAARLEKV